MSELYKSIGGPGLSIDLSIVALEEAALNMRAARTYKLFIGKRLWVVANLIVKSIGACQQNNPFAPCINVIELDKLKPGEWFIEGDAYDAWGSTGV